MGYKNKDILNIFRVCMFLILYNLLVIYVIYRVFSNFINYFLVFVDDMFVNLGSEINK